MEMDFRVLDPTSMYTIASLSFFLCQSHCPLLEGLFKKTNIACFCPQFGKFNLEPNLLIFYYYLGKQVAHMASQGNSEQEFVFSLPMTLNKICQDTPKCFLFVVTNLTTNFVGFLLLPDKVYVDAINDLQYRIANIHMKSKMYVKYGHANYF